MHWSEGLSLEQKVAASHNGCHALLLAGPGTGKTRVLTRRVLYLIQELGVLPSSIVALTFTRAAAGELRQEVREALKVEAEAMPHVSTISSYALSQLLRNPGCSDLPEPLRIADDYEEGEIVVRDMMHLLKTDAKTIRDLVEKVGDAWAECDEDKLRDSLHKPEFVGAWRDHRTIYGYTLRAELVFRFVQALKRGELERWDAPRFLLIDEYQDLNPCEQKMVREIEKHGTKIYIAGDDDQGIYGWRGASRKGIEQFPSEYNAATLTLEECWRCSPAVLAFASSVIRQDYKSVPKVLRPIDGLPRGTVRVLRFENQLGEANGIAALCEWLGEQAKVPYGEVLILLRSDHQGAFSKPIISALAQRGLPVTSVSDPLAPLGTKQGREFLAFLYLAVNPRDHLAWRSLFAVRNNNLGQVAFNGLYDKAKREGLTFWEALDRVGADPDWAPAKGDVIRREIQEIQAALKGMDYQQDSALDKWLYSVAERMITDSDARADVMGLFERVMQSGECDTLQKLLRATNTKLAGGEQERDANVISVMTMHQAKGLTASAVIIAAAEEQNIPAGRSGDEKMEELRLLYVSLTRARSYLFVTYCGWRFGHQSHKGSNASTGRARRSLTTFLRDIACDKEMSGPEFIKRLASQ